MKSWLLTLLLLTLAEVVSARPARIILLRHGEKPPERYALHLDERGQARARALVPFLTTNQVVIADGLPVALFAPESTPRGHGRRPYETLKPLAERLGLPIQTPSTAQDVATLAEKVLKDPDCDGKTVVICWVHDYLPALAKKLGLKPGPPPWRGEVYDRVWVITYHKRHAALIDLPQNLLPGDSSK